MVIALLVVAAIAVFIVVRNDQLLSMGLRVLPMAIWGGAAYLVLTLCTAVAEDTQPNPRSKARCGLLYRLGQDRWI